MIDVVELGVADAQRAMHAGTTTSQELTRAYVARIEAIDRSGPRLNAVIELDATALEQARRFDTERAEGRVRGPLHGIPVLLKDNIDVAGLVNSAGSLALANHRPLRDACLVARLRAAGAVVLGKSNLSEWANFRSSRSTSGWSSRGGQTRNPYALDRNPGGSSAGTGCAIAAGLATVGVGTETDGSIIVPAALNGLVGMKPTVGLVGRSGIIPISATQDTAGPMGRTVADVAALLGALAGPDPYDPASSRAPAATDYAACLDDAALDGARLGLVRQAIGSQPDVGAALRRATTTLTHAGAEVMEVDVAGFGSWGKAELEVLLFEFKHGLNEYLRRNDGIPRSLAELIEWNARHRAAVMPWFGQDLFERAQAQGPLTDPAYRRARDDVRRCARDDALLRVLDAHRLDALIVPSDGPAWLTDPLLGDRPVGRNGASIAAAGGTPSITVPMGAAHGLPLGLTLLGRDYCEGTLIGFAYAFEHAHAARTPPRYLPTIATTHGGSHDAHG